MTYNQQENRYCLKLPEAEQDVFCQVNARLIQRVPNQWGRQGWTLFYPEGLDEAVLLDALMVAYRHVAPKKLAALVPLPGSGNHRDNAAGTGSF